MANNYYKFITQWRIKAPLIDVWYAIYNSEEWPLWWAGVEDVTVVRENDVDGINGIKKYTWKSILPYTLSFKMRLVKKEDFELLSGIAFGELEGNGTWYFTEENGVTKVRYFWNVRTNKAWMNNFAFILRPLFKLNHDVVMKWGAKGLSRKLGAKLIST